MLYTPTAVKRRPQEVDVSLAGTTVTSQGIGKRRWKFDAQIRFGDARSGWATIPIVEAWLNGTNSFKLQDMRDATVYDCKAVNLSTVADAIKLRSAVPYDPNSFYIVPFEFQET